MKRASVWLPVAVMAVTSFHIVWELAHGRVPDNAIIIGGVVLAGVAFWACLFAESLPDDQPK